MTPEELYRYDLRGFLYVEDAIDPDLLSTIDAAVQSWLEVASRGMKKDNPTARIDDILNQEKALLPLVDNPRVVPMLDELVLRPRLKSTWVTFQHPGGWVRDGSNHTPPTTHNYYTFHGRICHNLFQVFYAIRDIGPDDGCLCVIPGSHKANYALPPDVDVDDLLVPVPMKAGSVLLFTHDLFHASHNRGSRVRHTVIFTYCPGVIANSFGGDGLYRRLFEEAPEGTWLKYLLREPNGFRETYERPGEHPVRSAVSCRRAGTGG